MKKYRVTYVGWLEAKDERSADAAAELILNDNAMQDHFLAIDVNEVEEDDYPGCDDE